MSDTIADQFLTQIITVWQEIFGQPADFDLAGFKSRYAHDIPLPQEQTCAITHSPVFLQRPTAKVVSRAEINRRQTEKSLITSPEPINSIQDLLTKFDRINYFAGDFVQNSTNTFRCDQVYSSTNVYESASVFTSKNMAFCYGVSDSEMAFACKDNKQLSYCIRCFESKLLTNCFEVYNAGKCSNSMFIHDSYDLRDCLFCFHIVSAQYCVANMQYTKEDYLRIKQLVIDWIQAGNTYQF